MKVAVLMGGTSAEREISLRTGRGMVQALTSLGHEPLAIDAADGRLVAAGDLPRLEAEAGAAAAAGTLVPGTPTGLARADSLNAADVVLIALHGGAGENGTLQALLELAGKPYTGSGVLASALAMNKAMSKRVFVQAGIATPRWFLVAAGAGPDAVDAAALGGFPIVVKPNEEGSTVGLTIVPDEAGIGPALRLAADYGRETLVEEYIDGRELTVAVLGREPLPIVEIRPKSGFYDYAAKYTAGASEYFCPADLPASLAAEVSELGRRAAEVLGCAGISRVDFRLDAASRPYCLEVNTIPGMTPTSLVPMAAKAAGLSYDQVVQRMLDLALAEARRKGGARPASATS